jgi:hypothetical protein
MRYRLGGWASSMATSAEQLSYKEYIREEYEEMNALGPNAVYRVCLKIVVWILQSKIKPRPEFLNLSFASTTSERPHLQDRHNSRTPCEFERI